MSLLKSGEGIRRPFFNRTCRAGMTLLSVMLVMFLVNFAPAQVPAQTDASRAANEVTLLPDRIILPPGVQDAVSLTSYSVDTSIKDNLATTTVTQTYKNTAGRTLEARYLFPLPPDANFSSFTLTVNGKTLEGKILAKDEARSTYQEIVRKMIDPGLLEYIDDKTVQVSIAPFFANETKTIKLSYTQLLKADGGLYKYTYYLGNQAPGTINRPGPVPTCRPWEHCAIPLNNPSRCVRGGGCIDPRDIPVLPSLNLTLDLKTAQTLKTVYSPTHDPKISRSGTQNATATLSLKPQDVLREKNFVLYFSQDNAHLTVNTLNYQKDGENGYFLMTVRTPETLKAEALPKDVVLVVDTSGSMSGEKIKQAREAVKTIINHLRPEDRFGLLQFNTDVSSFRNELIPASPANRQAALSYADSLEANGSTNIEAALKEGFGQLKNHDAKRPAYVIFLTDGEPTVGVTDTEGLAKVAKSANTHEGKLFAFGVGYDLNALLLGKLADGNHGSTTFVEPNENLELAMTGFYKKIEAPVLTDATLDFDGPQVSKVYPAQLGDLFAGSEVILLGRYAGAGNGFVTLSGKVGGETKSYRFPVHWSASTEHGQLPRLWAGRRIATLLDAMRQNGENNETKDEIIALSKQYGIITPYTSFLATEGDDVRRQDAAMPTGSGGMMRRDMPGRGAMPASAPAPMASRAAMKSASGQGAVQFSKRLKAMQNQASAEALDEAQSLADGKDKAITLKTVGTKTFQLTNGVWTDTAYDEKTHGKPQQITFGTEAYFKLLADKPDLVQYFSLGEQVIVLLDGKAWQVLPARVAVPAITTAPKS